MDKTIKINLGGNLFQIDEEAYKILRDYLRQIDSRLRYTEGGAETIEDIELRIAEIFQSQKHLAGVITKENVDAMISIIGKPEDFVIPGEAEEKSSHYQSTAQKKLYRNPDDKIISGVCSGIGAYLNIESVWIRLIFIIMACFFLIGFFIYLALWIALPSAVSDIQKRDMFGGRQKSSTAVQQSNNNLLPDDPGYRSASTGTSSVGNAFNEVFKAIGKVFYIILRVFLIIVGASFVITGFAALVSFIMVFFFKYPGYFSTSSFDVNLFYLPDFLNYVVNPAVAPWIIILSFIVILMPLLALIYWGVKMIFWFRAKDGVVTLIGLILWVISIAALSLLLFNEGISFAEVAKTVSGEVMDNPPEVLYISSRNKVSDLSWDKEISVSDENYNIFLKEDNNGMYISTRLKVYRSEDNSLILNIRKRSTGRSKSDATRKADELIYNYSISGDTIFLDDYFSIPPGNKWSFDNVGVNLRIPEKTVVHFDKNTLEMFRHYDNNGWDNESENNIYNKSELTWEMTEDGLIQK